MLHQQLKTEEAELGAKLQQDLASKQDQIKAKVATQEQQANEAAHSAEAQAEALGQQSVQEKENELKEDAATAEQEVPAEDFSLEEQIEAVTKEHTEAVEGILSDSAKLKEENADLEARVTTAKSNKELDLAKRKESEGLEAKFREWGQVAAVSVEDAAISLDKAQSEATGGVEAKKEAAEQLLAAINAETATPATSK